MNLVDKVLLRLATPALRDTMFDAESLAQIVAAAYDTSLAVIEPTFRAVFDEVLLGLAVPRTGSVEGQFGALDSASRGAASLSISGLGGGHFVVDALWKGFIVATTTAPSARIESVRTQSIDLMRIDADIVAALGGLPADPAVRAAERGSRLQAAIAAAAAQPGVATAERVARAIAAVGARDINDYFDNHSGTSAYGPVQVQFSAPAAAPASTRPLALSAALIVREGIGGLAQLLADSRMAREQLELAGHGRRDTVAGLPQKHSVVVVWILPQTVFQDSDWPGADPAARRSNAGEWLAREGVGLAVTA